jgi:uncharacterized LabA/DUF88 family protein
MIDGGFLRARAAGAGITYAPGLVERVAHACCAENERPLRFLYYDCAPYNGKAKLPISGNEYVFEGSDGWLRELAERDLFAVRRGVLKFRGFKARRIPALADDDFRPDFEQKGVDMRIGLDLAGFAVRKSVDRVALVTSDIDCIPAMKLARIGGLQVVLVSVPGQKPAPDLLWHSDFHRRLEWPVSPV